MAVLQNRAKGRDGLFTSQTLPGSSDDTSSDEMAALPPHTIKQRGNPFTHAMMNRKTVITPTSISRSSSSCSSSSSSDDDDDDDAGQQDDIASATSSDISISKYNKELQRKGARFGLTPFQRPRQLLAEVKGMEKMATSMKFKYAVLRDGIFESKQSTGTWKKFEKQMYAYFGFVHLQYGIPTHKLKLSCIGDEVKLECFFSFLRDVRRVKVPVLKQYIRVALRINKYRAKIEGDEATKQVR